MYPGLKLINRVVGISQAMIVSTFFTIDKTFKLSLQESLGKQMDWRDLVDGDIYLYN